MNKLDIARTGRSAFGAELDLGRLSGSTSAQVIDQLRNAVCDHGFVILRDQHFTDDALKEFASRFGDIEQRVIKYSTMGPSKSRQPFPWHHHSHCVDRLDDWIVYYTPAVPQDGGATEFFDASAWFDRLTPADQQWARQQSVRHNYESVAHSGVEPVATPEWHPMVVSRHCANGSKLRSGGQEALYWGAHAQEIRSEDGLPGDHAATLARILALADDPELTRKPVSKPNDVLIWDMLTVAHRSWPWTSPSLRVIHEVVIKSVTR